jgi:type II restriction/modification system DNA methylase subunit YeeA
MNRSALRSFAMTARRELLNKVKSKAMKIGITEEKIKKADVEGSDAIFIDGRQLSSEEKTQRKNLIKLIEQKGFNQVMEEVAYTWFNRFTALRFMEVNEYLPSNVRVLSSANPEDPIPDILKEAMSLDFDIDKEWVYERKVKNENDKLFQYLIIKQCNDLNEYLPFMFEKIDDFTQILFPEGMLSKDSFIRQMTDTDSIPEEDWANVEIIGWLYQYYIAEEKNRVIHAKKRYKTEEIPFATQLFTPDWIVQYMVQNSLGRYWVENHPEDKELINNWEFYLESSNSEDDLDEKLAPYLNKELNVEDIKCFDPAMGSGHILVYMFDVLYQVYSRSGYLERDIPRLIIENNLYGLDIDDRAYQLACFSVVMKAMQYNKRFLRNIKRNGLEMNLSSIHETNVLTNDDISFLKDGEKNEVIKKFINRFKDAKNFGSLIKVEGINLDIIEEKLIKLKNNLSGDLFENLSREKLLNLLPKLIKQYKILINNYEIIVTNPPYMGSKYMNNKLKEFMGEEYPNSKTDTFSAFMESSINKVTREGHLGMITPYVWMFISTYKELRNLIVNNTTISSLIQFEYNAFPEATVPVCTFTLRNNNTSASGEFIRLSDFVGSDQQVVKTKEAISNPNIFYRYTSNNNKFKKIPGSVIGYWASDKLVKIFEEEESLVNYAQQKTRISTGDNKRFLRHWYEVDYNKFCLPENFTQKNKEESKWFPYNKGGSFKRWYGNNTFVVNYGNDGEDLKGFKGYQRNDENFYFKKGLTWSSLTTGKVSFRYSETGFLSDQKGPLLYIKDFEKHGLYLLGMLNSVVTQNFLYILAPTLDYIWGSIALIPTKLEEKELIRINDLVNDNIFISKMNWDSYETSWGFQYHPFLSSTEGKLIERSFQLRDEQYKKQFTTLKQNEEKLNSIYLDIYGLDQEIQKDIEDKDISLNETDREKGVKSFISYAVGCMFGRYSLDCKGVTYAGGKFDDSKYHTFNADRDNILPILSGAYFEDDIVSRFVEFVKVTFGEDNLGVNLDFIADTLGKKKSESAKETIRRYFLSNFFKDHVQTYKKRPIYWLFTSGKQKAFNCLIYMHRYDSTTLGRIRTDYLHELQTRMDAEKESLISVINGESTSKEINQAKKDLKLLEKKIEELKDYDEVLHHMADQQIEIDLDDGVEVNYEKFKGLLAKK